MSELAALLVRDMRIAVRVGGGALMGVMFFLVVVAIVPFAVGPDLALLKRIGPAILWLAALLASLLALDRLFAADHEDGSLDLLLMSRAPLELVVLVKGVAHWLTTGLPLIIAAPLIGLLLNLDGQAQGGAGADAIGRHAGFDVHRPDRRRHRGGVAPRRPSARRSRVAADGAGPDLRRGRRQRRGGRAGHVRHAVHGPVRAVAGEPGGRPLRRRGRAAARD